MLVFFVNVKAQETEKIRLLCISYFSEFRDSILFKNPSGIEEVKHLTEKWKNLRSKEEELDQFVNRVYNFSVSTDYEEEVIVKILKTSTTNSELSNSLEIGDVRIIRENIDLLGLIQMGILESAYPFRINTESELIEEILHYEVKEGEKIGEIGAGGGDFSLMLYRILPKIELYINELEQFDLVGLKKKIDDNVAYYDIERINLIIGSEESTNLEGYELDKIIIRNAFHHFSDKEKMLASIKISLKNDGKLYVLETTKDLNRNKGRCKYAMKEKDIVEIFEMNGYELIEDM